MLCGSYHELLKLELQNQSLSVVNKQLIMMNRKLMGAQSEIQLLLNVALIAGIGKGW